MPVEAHVIFKRWGSQDISIFISHTWRWPCRPKHVVKDSENQHSKAAHRRKHNL
jgi:hypothetical protein